jgi:hypothetical protein
MTFKESIDKLRLLEKYGGDEDVLKLLSENSRIRLENSIIFKKNCSLLGQLRGLHKFIRSKKFGDNIKEDL